MDREKDSGVPSSFAPELARRDFLKGSSLLAGGAALSLGRTAWGAAANWPDRQVMVVVPYTPGGNADPLARILAQQLSKQSGQGFVVENKPGASSTIGAAFVARSPADGYTLLSVTPTFVITKFIYPHLSYDGQKDMMPLGLLFTDPMLLVVNPSLKVKTVQEYIQMAKANPGKITFSTSGVGSSPHLALELLKQQAGIDVLHVPYQGGAPALSALISGDVTSSMLSWIEVSEYVKKGQLLAIGVTSLDRTPRLKDIPTINESGVTGYEVMHYTGFVVRSATPPDVVQQMSAQLQKALADPEVKAKILPFGDPLSGSMEEAKAIMDRDYARWGPVVKAANISL
jgi:tripartite-type tricarboxylate transporter receptor subunit TctC